LKISVMIIFRKSQGCWYK